MARSRPHPGKILKDDYLVPSKMSARRLAAAIDVAPNRITAIINGDRSVTADTALRLGRYFETSSEFWLELQMAHDLSMAERAGNRIEGPLTPRSNGGSLIDRSVAFCRELRARSHPERGKPADKAFIDSLYEDS